MHEHTPGMNASACLQRRPLLPVSDPEISEERVGARADELVSELLDADRDLHKVRGWVPWGDRLQMRRKVSAAERGGRVWGGKDEEEGEWAKCEHLNWLGWAGAGTITDTGGEVKSSESRDC